MSGLDLGALEAIVDRTGMCADLEAAMPRGGRPRQLSVRTLLVGILLALADDRPAHLSRVQRALASLPPGERVRLGVVVAARGGDHVLTYRQVERTFSTMTAVMDPTPVPSFAGVGRADRAAHLARARDGIDANECETRLRSVCDELMEASVAEQYRTSSSSVAVDWTDVEAWSRPAEKDSEFPPADPDASWGHRTTNMPGARGELFFGFYGQAVTMVQDEAGPAVPELVRRICLEACSLDPARAMATVLQAMAHDGVVVGDVLADSGYSHRLAQNWATPLRALGAQLVQDLHPHDRGTKGTYGGAIIANGNLYCPATPKALIAITPLPWGPSDEVMVAHDRLAAELARYKLGRQSTDDHDGFHRVACPASAGKVRCPLKPASMGLAFDRPEVLAPPEGTAPRCCAQASLTVPPEVNAKTSQKHDYPGPAHRRSYARRTGAERSFSTLKDPASTNIRRGWCRLLGRTKNLVMLTCATVVRNLRVVASFERRQANDAQRVAEGRPARTRRRRHIAVTAT